MQSQLSPHFGSPSPAPAVGLSSVLQLPEISTERIPQKLIFKPGALEQHFINRVPKNITESQPNYVKNDIVRSSFFTIAIIWL